MDKDRERVMVGDGERPRVSVVSVCMCVLRARTGLAVEGTLSFCLTLHEDHLL